MPADITRHLQAMGRALRRARLAVEALRLLAVTLTVWLAWCALDNVLHLPAGVRVVMAVAGLAGPA